MTQSEISTHYAPAARSNDQEILKDIATITNHALIDEVMNASGGMFAVLNEQRQIVAMNAVFLEAVGISNINDTLGLRLGEHLSCVHACEMPGGCGTSEYCSTCGAVIATVTALDADEPVEKNCVIKAEKDYQEIDFYFNVRCNPIWIEGKHFILLYLQDVSIHQQWAYLEQTFLHDISNSLQGLLGTSSQLTDISKLTKERMDRIKNLTTRIAQEVAAQKSLSTTLSHSYQPLYTELSVFRVFDELQETFKNHPLARNHNLSFTKPDNDIHVMSDHALVIRVLVNMISNALEATVTDGVVTVTMGADGDTIIFRIWNQGYIQEAIAKRIFQRNFSTKEGFGHGLGTYSMKLFGEKVLGGKIGFTTSEMEGTTFWFAMQVR